MYPQAPHLLARCIVMAFLLTAMLVTSACAQTGIASQYVRDQGLESHPSVLYYLDFDNQQSTQSWYGSKAGYGWTDTPDNVLAGGGALEIQQTEGTHLPSEIHPWIPETDIAYVRWYRKWEPGYDFTQHKMPGVYAWADGLSGGGAGEIPNGYDKYSCKLYVDFERRPRFYTYHPEQSGIYGDGLLPNLANPYPTMVADRWYCFEMMIKANDAGSHNGELKMWIDGDLVGHYDGMRFRDTNDLKINQFTYSAYVGGTWTSLRDQKLWDDQIVVATEYIGPIQGIEPVAQESFAANRDTGLYREPNQEHVNTGARSTVRAGKRGPESGTDWEKYLCDFDTASIANWLGENPLGPGESYRVTYTMFPTSDNPLKQVELSTVWSTTDWTEGNGEDWDANYGWTTDSAATGAYAQDTTPDSSQAVPWHDPQSDTDVSFDELGGIVNSQIIDGMMAGGTTVELDKAFWQDLIFNEHCRGLVQRGYPLYDSEGDNDTMYTIEGGYAPLLTFELIPAPFPLAGDVDRDGNVDAVDLAVVASHWDPTGQWVADWSDGDFDEDGDVDAEDLAAVGLHWSPAGYMDIPEPASVVGLVLGGLAMLRRKG